MWKNQDLRWEVRGTMSQEKELYGKFNMRQQHPRRGNKTEYKQKQIQRRHGKQNTKEQNKITDYRRKITTWERSQTKKKSQKNNKKLRNNKKKQKTTKNIKM